MPSFEIRGGERAASLFVARLKMVELVPSLASLSTTISHPAKTSHRSLSEEQRQRAGISGGLIRLSAGIEPVEPVWEDISQALDSLDQAD
ncbi:MAG: PLP-dependent transferase [Thermovirgaceae bacterium]|nr:PLP-dependent transferase [Thermovirgaceae bacterium]